MRMGRGFGFSTFGMMERVALSGDEGMRKAGMKRGKPVAVRKASEVISTMHHNPLKYFNSMK